MGYEVQALDIDVPVLLPLIWVRFVEFGEGGQVSGIVDQDVDMSESVFDRFGGCDYRLAVGHIQFDCHELRLFLASFFGCLFCCGYNVIEFGARTKSNASCTGASVRDGAGFSNALRSPGDEDDFAAQIGLRRVDGWVRVVVDRGDEVDSYTWLKIDLEKTYTRPFYDDRRNLPLLSNSCPGS